MKVLLAIPTGGQPAAPFVESLRALQLPPAVTAFDRITVTGNFIPGQRELAMRRALAAGADVLLMIDDDMIVPPYAAVALLAAFEADPALGIVGALYYSRDGIRPVAANRWKSGDTTSAAIPAFTDRVTWCDAVGFGCVAVRMAAVRTLVAPYFHTQVYVEEHAARVRVCNEDFLFCEAMRAGGWGVALHAGVRVPHFDRASGIAYPQNWESAEHTGTERMIVMDPGPVYRLAPYDVRAAATTERHSSARVDYVLVD